MATLKVYNGSEWVPIGGGANPPVTSVFTRTGGVVAAAGDYAASQITDDSRRPASPADVGEALDDRSRHEGTFLSPFGVGPSNTTAWTELMSVTFEAGTILSDSGFGAIWLGGNYTANNSAADTISTRVQVNGTTIDTTSTTPALATSATTGRWRMWITAYWTDQFGGFVLLDGAFMIGDRTGGSGNYSTGALWAAISGTRSLNHATTDMTIDIDAQMSSASVNLKMLRFQGGAIHSGD